ncbi:DUF4265 domain-containing protein [Marinibactrum halimedae]|uniref:DUF4265 domain-containing protein n=1 Tax=Marinibactrum halimedae TaxID=1444977 RepID=A0AA37WRE6_9GAMM|nr:DUF4265 domain-containing protein [Marinibactrum halimedae]MCD9459965.1 DUF4265 domain-containing protein [Marinibactrum halimedae]GLS28267.1 hypothetical protein GCM10007877_39860 [Marinibactrum halimedae]
MQALQVIELFAGHRPDGQPVVERLQVQVLDDDSCRLVKSPVFVKGVASGDVVKLVPNSQEFEVVKRAGNLCIRVFSRDDIEALGEAITPHLEKLGGELDHENPRFLVYSIHVSCGFQQIEAIFNDALSQFPNSQWLYANVYDPNDGTTPLNWWNEFLKPE